MKKVLSIILTFAVLATMCISFTSCGKSEDTYTVGICQFMVHDSLDQANTGLY